MEETWQSWRSEIEANLDEIDISSFDAPQNVNLIHVRRGDTLAMGSTHGVLTNDYFMNAISANSKSYMCTDEHTLPMEFLEGETSIEVLGPQSSNTWQSLKLFRYAKEFHGCNSTLSWWGAKLSSTSLQNIQILPTPWLGFKESSADDSLFIPTATYVKAK